MSDVTEELRTRSLDGPSPWSSCSDEGLLGTYRAKGDSGAFAELVRRYERELFGYLRHYLGNAEMAEDVFQQTFLQVHLKCDQFEVGRKVRPWLYTVATNQAIDYRRRNRRHRLGSLNRAVDHNAAEDEAGALAELLGGAEKGPADNAESAEQNDALHRAIDALGEPSKQVVMLVYFQGMKYREAAQILSIPVGTVKSRLHAAMLKLTESLSHVNLPN